MIQFYENILGCKVERTVDSIGLYQLRAGTSLIDIVDTEGSSVGAVAAKRKRPESGSFLPAN